MAVLAQAEADTLRRIEKFLTNPHNITLLSPHRNSIHQMHYFHNGFRKDDMKLSTFHSEKNTRKVSYRILYNGNIVLIRIDTQDATPHINPDGQLVIPPYQPHVHIYQEGYSDKFAYPLPEEFQNTDNIIELFMEFLSYSNVINKDDVQIQEVLFHDI